MSAAGLAVIGATMRLGYTGHEHLDAVGLIHMNGRVYDPVVGRFLSRDPFIDGVQSSQGANGYAYAHSKPLVYTDSSGCRMSVGDGCRAAPPMTLVLD